MTSRNPDRTGSPLFESLEHRVLYDATLDTGYGWKITYPTGVTLATPTMLSNHLVVRETISDTTSNRPLFFERAPVQSGRTRAEFFALDITARNNTAGPSNKFQLQLVDYGDFHAGPDANHPRWAHFHGGSTLAYSTFGSMAFGTPTTFGPTQKIEFTNGSVQPGQNFTMNGGVHPETGFRIHMGADYPSNSFSMYQALYWDTRPDALEANDTSGSATNLGSVSSSSPQTREHLTLHPVHGFAEDADVDFFKFTASQTGWAGVRAQFSSALGNVDVQVLDSSQHVLATGNSTNDIEDVRVNVQAGQTYFVKVFNGAGSRSQRDYSLRVNVTPATAAPEINLYKMDGTQIPFTSTEVFNVGSVMQGTFDATLSFRVRNDGGQSLNVGIGNVPQGFLITGLGGSIAGGQEQVFTVRLNSAAPIGTYSGRLGITNNDADEGTAANNTFGLNLTGRVVPQTTRVTGRVFLDANGNGRPDANERGVPGWRVFYDANRDGNYQLGEAVATTDSTGRWTLPAVPSGSDRRIRIDTRNAPSVQFPFRSWRVTTPISGVFSTNLIPGTTTNDLLFGVLPTL